MVLKVQFDQEFERKFRELAMRKYGFSKGSIKKASREAIRGWIKKVDINLPKIKDSIKAIRGAMKHLRGKYTSVELQHEAMKLWAKQD